MKITGVDLQFAIQRANSKLTILEKKFLNGLKSFENEPKEDVIGISNEIEKHEFLVAELKSVLTRYNLQNQFEFEGHSISLAQAIRIVSALDKTEIRWRSTIDDRVDRYGNSEQRSNDTRYKEHVLSFDQRAAQQDKAKERAARIRKAIQLANARSLDLDLEMPVALRELLT